MWVWNLVSNINRRTEAAGAWKWGPDVYTGVVHYLFVINNCNVWETVKKQYTHKHWQIMPDWKQQYTHILSGLGLIILGSWYLYHVWVHDVIILNSSACLNYIKFIKQDLFVVCFLLGNSQASEFYMPTFRETLSGPSS